VKFVPVCAHNDKTDAVLLLSFLSFLVDFALSYSFTGMKIDSVSMRNFSIFLFITVSSEGHHCGYVILACLPFHGLIFVLSEILVS
jgi:hypothetical protein